jgi:RNA polymerase sigma-70 factor (ECF subfamily)
VWDNRDVVESLRDLVSAAAAGDRHAFERVVDQTIDRMYGVARRILQDDLAAEDAVQEALIAVWRDLGGLRDPARFEAWAYRLLVRACYRLAARERRSSTGMPIPASADSVSDAIADFAERDAMSRALAQLKPEHRAVVVLHHYADLPLTEVAAILAIPTGTARSRLHYALRRIRPFVQHQLEASVHE